MHDDTDKLTEREKETLRLLASGHEAKSIAAHLGLSIHTVNERLRASRRKLGVSSSRAAARQLLGSECDHPQFFGDKILGDAAPAAGVERSRRSTNPRGPLWALGIGGLMMFALATSVLLINLTGAGFPASSVAPPTPSAAPESASEVADDALVWLSLLDQGAWGESWEAAGAMFKAQVSAESWTTSVRAVRDPLGPVASRVQRSAQRTSSLPGAPEGDYWIIQYQAAFANRSDATETVVLAREGAAWRVVGYFVR